MKRNIGQEILDGIEAIETGCGTSLIIELPKDVKAVSAKTGLSQQDFAGVVGVNVRTLHECEQGWQKLQGSVASLLGLLFPGIRLCCGLE